MTDDRAAPSAAEAPHPPLDIAVLQAAAGEAVGMLKLLANPDRLLLLCQLTQGEQCVSDLENRLGIRQPTLSQQLGVLRQEGLVQTRREGKHIFYRVCNDRALTILQLLYQLYCPPAMQASPLQP
ncbi:metalloregulator ArsR/SmtB family transcription factor [Aquabacterium sp.]|uniref:ArsR/SmtB family transcription factor n=1 Tax=Aquabacterium sp. TaxID=1872578 RepID=UPI0025C1B9D6|nr:metalloregulator ArsR/SmtB family transcription factor [Aquabacterium sp.]